MSDTKGRETDMRRQIKSPKHYPTEGLATITEATEFLSCSYKTVERHIASKLLPSCKIGKRRLIAWADLWAIVDRRKSSN